MISGMKNSKCPKHFFSLLVKEFFLYIESQDDFSHYLLGDKVFPFLFQLMTLFKVDSQDHIILKIFDNRKRKHGQYVIENAFEILKCIFREFKGKIELDVIFLPNVVTCCCLLNNVLF